jgi:hypothetical protein
MVSEKTDAPKIYSHAEMMEAIEVAAERAAEKAHAMTVSELHYMMGLDPEHPDFREHRRQKRDHQEYLGRQYEGQRKAKTWFFRGLLAGIGTFITTAIWKGWDIFVNAFTSTQP